MFNQDRDNPQGIFSSTKTESPKKELSSRISIPNHIYPLTLHSLIQQTKRTPSMGECNYGQSIIFILLCFTHLTTEYQILPEQTLFTRVLFYAGSNRSTEVQLYTLT